MDVYQESVRAYNKKPALFRREKFFQEVFFQRRQVAPLAEFVAYDDNLFRLVIAQPFDNLPKKMVVLRSAPFTFRHDAIQFSNGE